MKKPIIVLFALLASLTVFAESSITSVRFDFSAVGRKLTCATFQVQTDGGKEFFAPVFVFPSDLAEVCTVGRSDSLLVTPTGAARIENLSNRWYLSVRDVRYPAEPGRLYLAIVFGSTIEIVPKDHTFSPSEIKGAFQQSIVEALKTAEPGATDNPDDAQRLREGH